ncbi:MAG: glycosyltransferase family 4 protein [Candidatus Woesearchaeota archaeon]
MKTKLLIATDNFPPRWDGIGRFLTEIVPRISEHFDITIVAPDYGSFEIPGVKIVKIPVFKLFKFGDFNLPKFKYFKIKKMVLQNDIVFIQTIGSIGYLALSVAKKFHKPLSAFMHSIESELVPNALAGILKKYSYSLIRKFMMKSYNKCDLLMVPSQGIAELIHWQGIEKRTEVVHLGTDTEKFIPPKNKNEAKKLFGFSSEDIIIGYHGRISREKDLKTLLRAFVRLQSRFKNIKLMIVGEGLLEIKEMLSKREGVILIGPKNDVVPYLQAMDIYALTSLTETTSLSTLEAMSCELPVVATSVGYIKEYITSGINGFLFSKQDVYSLTKILEKLITSQTLRLSIGKSARKTILDKFNWDVTAKKIEFLLENL